MLDKQSGKEEIYDLIAVDDHWGGLGGGHYTAFAKNFMDGEWYEYNGTCCCVPQPAPSVFHFAAKLTHTPIDSIVSRVGDPAKVVTAAAYLLFYRRRSQVPLGGPRFREIVDRCNNGDSSDDDLDDMSESGEGQRLDIGSSRLGSSSALKGAGATLRLESPGLVASGASSKTLNTNADADQDYLPTYQQAGGASGDVDDDDDVQPLLGSSMLSFGDPTKDAMIRRSIEADEGIEMGCQETGWGQQPWSFERVEAEALMASDEGHNSSDDTDVNSMGPGVSDRDRDDKADYGPPEGYSAPPAADDEFAQYELPPPPPDSADQANMDAIRNQVWDSKKLHHIPPDVGRDQDSDNAVDIHVGEEEMGEDGLDGRPPLNRDRDWIRTSQPPCHSAVAGGGRASGRGVRCSFGLGTKQ